MARRRADGQAGFIITLEFLLIMTILGIGVLVGLAAVRNALFKRAVNQRAQTVWVYDSNVPPIVLGPARDFDEHEAPRLFYIDYELGDEENVPEEADPMAAWVGRNYRAFVGVRDDRFTGRHRIFYTDSLDCGRTMIDGGDEVRACITGASREDQDNLGVGTVTLTLDGTTTGLDTFSISQTLPLEFAGGQGYLYALQDGPTYGIGRDVAALETLPSDLAQGLPGTLYRQTMSSCTDADTFIRSMWTSQSVVPGEPCTPLPEGIVVTSAKCPVGQDGPSIGGQCSIPPSGNVDQRCVTAGTCSLSGTGCATAAECPDENETCETNLADYQCACPMTADGILENNWFEVGANCCPPGTTSTTQAGQCIIGGEGILFRASRVQRDGENVFANLASTFHVNLPPDPNAFEFLAPTKEGQPGTPTGIPYDVQDFQFNRAPDGEGP